MSAPLFLAAIAWVSVFGMMWLLFVDAVPPDAKRLSLLVGSFLVAVMTSAVTSGSKDGDSDG